MDTSLTTTQVILIWALLGFLLAWMITFGVLAFRSNTPDPFKPEDLPNLPNPSSVNTASTMLHMIVTQPIPVQNGIDRQDTGEMEKVTIA